MTTEQYTLGAGSVGKVTGGIGILKKYFKIIISTVNIFIFIKLDKQFEENKIYNRIKLSLDKFALFYYKVFRLNLDNIIQKELKMISYFLLFTAIVVPFRFYINDSLSFNLSLFISIIVYIYLYYFVNIKRIRNMIRWKTSIDFIFLIPFLYVNI